MFITFWDSAVPASKCVRKSEFLGKIFRKMFEGNFSGIFLNTDDGVQFSSEKIQA
jgi:hypothetical protein